MPLALNSAVFLLGNLMRGGSETKFVRMASRLADQGLPVILAWLADPQDLLDEIPDHVEKRPIGLDKSLSAAGALRLGKVIRDDRAQRIVCVNFFPMIYGWVASQMTPSLRLFASINTTDLHGTREKRFMCLYAPLLRRMDGVVFGSSLQQDRWTRQYRLRAESSEVIYIGVDAQRFKPAAERVRDTLRAGLGIARHERVIVSIAQLRPEKGHTDLLKAFSRLQSSAMCRLVLVGDGPMRERLESMASDLAISERVVFVGETRDVEAWLSLADIFVLASTSVETFSNAALEAAASGLPVVMTDIGGARELMGEVGEEWLVPPGDPVSLANTLGKLVDSPALQQAEGRAIRDRVLEHFNLSQMDDAWIQILWPEIAEKRSRVA